MIHMGMPILLMLQHFDSLNYLIGIFVAWSSHLPYNIFY